MDALIEAISGMTIGEVAKNAALLVVGLLSCVEFSKIKINPLSAILSWLGGRINGPLIEKIDALDKKQDEQKKSMEELRDAQDDNEIDRIRWEILEFARSCRNKEKHSLEQFTHIIDLNQKYHRTLERRNLENGQIDLEYNYIVQIYKKCQEENSFLQ